MEHYTALMGTIVWLSRHHHCQHRSSGHLLHHTCTWAADLQSLGPRHLWKCHVQLGPEGEDTDAINFIWYSMSIPINAIWQCLEIYLLPFNVTHEGSGQDIASEIFSSLIHLSGLHKSCSSRLPSVLQKQWASSYLLQWLSHSYSSPLWWCPGRCSCRMLMARSMTIRRLGFIKNETLSSCNV